MRITFNDGTFEECSPKDQRQISVAEVLIHPQRIPGRLTRVWDNPPIYTKLALVRCDIIVPDHYVLTSSGLKQVVHVDR